jgi:two-component system cell cycle response regulator CpdR
MARLLYVEDDELLKSVTIMALEDAGYEVTHARDGREAKAILAGGAAFDCIVSDISMPGGVSGVEVAEEARRRRPDCLTVLVSGYARAQLPPLPEGVIFVEKPYHIGQLMGALRH